MIPFNKPYCTGRELEYLGAVCQSDTMSGNGHFTKLCHQFFENKYNFKKCLLTTSGTDALEMCAMLCNLQPDDEVIVPGTVRKCPSEAVPDPKSSFAKVQKLSLLTLQKKLLIWKYHKLSLS